MACKDRQDRMGAAVLAALAAATAVLSAGASCGGNGCPDEGKECDAGLCSTGTITCENGGAPSCNTALSGRAPDGVCSPPAACRGPGCCVAPSCALANPCHIGLTSCIQDKTAPHCSCECIDQGPAPDGTPCGDGGACHAGSCG